MKCSLPCRFRLAVVGLLATVVVFSAPHFALAQAAALPWLQTVDAGTAFSVPTTGSGAATLYIVGPGGVLRRELQLGAPIAFGAHELDHAGHYVAYLVTGGSTQSAQFDVIASRQTATISFLAKPSRLPVDLPDGISGVVYVFDIFSNLVLQPQPVSFELSDASGRAQSHEVTSKNGVAWLKMNSAAKAGVAKFTASAGNIRETRVVEQVAGDPCTLRMNARRAGQNILLETEPVHDCAGNPVPDGTIVTFTEIYDHSQTTVDVPLKRGIAQTEVPDQSNAVISVAAGVVMGNEIRWSARQTSGRQTSDRRSTVPPSSSAPARGGQ